MRYNPTNPTPAVTTPPAVRPKQVRRQAAKTALERIAAIPDETFAYLMAGETSVGDIPRALPAVAAVRKQFAQFMQVQPANTDWRDAWPRFWNRDSLSREVSRPAPVKPEPAPIPTVIPTAEPVSCQVGRINGSIPEETNVVPFPVESERFNFFTSRLGT